MGTIRKRRLGKPAAVARHARRRCAGGRAGFTIVEVMVAVVVLVIAVVSIVGSMLSAMALNRVNRETAIAQQAARRMIEEVSGVPFRDAYVIYNAEFGDDGSAAIPERGPNFVVDGLQAQDDDVDGRCGRIEFPDVDNGGGNFLLDETTVDAGFAMPRDLSGDGAADTVLDAGYRLLPVRVWVEWRGVSGDRSIRFETMLSQR
jgi:type II secretory pathway pseudopilin PulG